MSSQTSTTNDSTRLLSSTLPALPLPPPILSLTPGTWAHDTMSRRVDKEILERTYQENKEVLESPPFTEALKRFNQLRIELQHAATTPLRHLEPLTDETSKSGTSPEMEEWKRILSPFINHPHPHTPTTVSSTTSATDTWLSAPWLVTEFYLYRRLLEALGYFNPKSPGYLWDPFAKQKRAGLISSVPSANHVLEKVEAFMPLTTSLSSSTLESPEFFLKGLSLVTALSLWGNKMDLSLWPADVNTSSVGVFTKILDSASENLLHDDSSLLNQVCANLQSKGGGQVDIIVDNAGFELVMDLVFADYLVATNVAKVVTFQLKAHPTFVSDAMEKDLIETVDYFISLDETRFPFAKKAAERWNTYLQQGRWKCHEDFFWVQGTAMWEMPVALRHDLNQRCDVAIVKGDANYRRLLGDRTWDFSAPFQDVVGAYFPCNVCALRTLKAEVGCGMAKEQTERAKSLDKNWLVNGRFGVVHFGSPLDKFDKN